MTNLRLSLMLSLFSFMLSAQQFPDSVEWLEVTSKVEKSVDGNLSNGNTLSSLRWAANSSVACFPATQNSYFDGNHVFYAFRLPAYSTVEISLESSAAVNLYALQIGSSDYSTVPPNVNRAICEASLTSGKDVIKLNAIKNPYNVVIGVAGADKLKTGSFTLKVNLETKTPEDMSINDDKPAKVYNIVQTKGEAKVYEGELSEGKQIPLQWAANSSVACFPATRFEEFRGNHVFYTIELPRYSKLIVTVEPVNGERINLYGFSGHDGTSLPPNINRVVSGEASYEVYAGSTDMSKSAGPQSITLIAINNPYKVLIGVAGARDVMSGAYRLKVELADR